jgi:hypothetical protein
MLATAFTADDTQSLMSYKSRRSVFPAFGFSVRGASQNKRLALINEQELFKLCAINLPRHSMLHAMPVSMQTDSIEVNRLRSHYIKMIASVWRVYVKYAFGTTCPVFGSFTQDGDLILPSVDVCDAC